MTKKQYNDDALYQEIMTSLEPGAAEYDRMMASGEAPAKRKGTSPCKTILLFCGMYPAILRRHGSHCR